MAWHNPATTGKTAVLQVRNAGGSLRQVYRAAISAEGFVVFPTALTLEDGDELLMTSNDVVVICMASGIEFTP